MPAQLLHILFGEDVLNAVVPSICDSRGAPWVSYYIRETVGAKGPFFRLGCQGPDLFYHNQRTRPMSLEYGTLLHRRGFGAFAAELLERSMGGRSPGSGPSAAAAYAIGFATHAFLDRAAHPYIVCKSGWVSPSKPETARYARCHAFFERIIDVLMLERLRGIDAAAWDQESLLPLPGEAELASLVDAVAGSLAAVFPGRAGTDDRLRQRIRNAFIDAAFFYRITNPARTSLTMRLPDGFEYLRRASGRSSVALVYPEKFAYGIDYLNLAREAWGHPCRPTDLDRRSLPDIYGDAMAAAAPAFSRLFGVFSETGLVPSSELARAIGDGGLSVAGTDGQPCAPIHAEPLPLDAVLDRQYRLRLKWIAYNMNPLGDRVD
jgi:hypothetical protein